MLSSGSEKRWKRPWLRRTLQRRKERQVLKSARLTCPPTQIARIPSGRRDESCAVLRQHLRSTLPECMVPSAFVLLEALPLTPNGKLDRQALPSPDGARHETPTPFIPPATEVERKLAAIFRELLGMNEIGVDDNFFDLGANSLMMVQIVEKIRTELGLKVSLVRLIQFPTLGSLATAIAGSETDPGHIAVPPEQNRAQLRKEMMQRRREVRGSRPLGLLTFSRYRISFARIWISDERPC
jgi:acyl carrier protein